MKVSATEFKAKCLSLIDRVESGGKTVTITKRGRVVAQLTAANHGEQPWLKLRNSAAEWKGDPFAPAVDEPDIDAFKDIE